MTVLQPFPRVTPESVGIPSKAIEAFVHNAYVSGIEMHSLMVLRHGKVCAEGWWKPYGPEKLHNVHSFTKTFVATAIGLLVEDGKISLDDTILSFFPESAPENPSENLRKMNLHHLLSMSTGHHREPQIRGEKDFLRAFLAWPVDHEPGTWFQYNSNATHMLSRVVHKVTGKTFVEFLRERILDKMGFGRIECSLNADGFPSGGGGFALTTEDMARLGQLYLDGGKWKGEQLVPEAWIRAATVPQSDNSNGEHRDGNEDWEAGYGYQLWMNDPYLSYRFDGAFGQEAVAYPDKDMVVLCTAATGNMPGLLRIMHRFLRNMAVDYELPETPVAQAHVRELMENLKLDELKPKGESWLKPCVDGKRIVLAPNDVLPFAGGFMRPSGLKPGVCALTPVFGDKELTLTLETPESTWNLVAGMDGEARLNCIEVEGTPTEVEVSALWADQNVLSVTWRSTRAVNTMKVDIIYHIDSVEVNLLRTPHRSETTVSAKFA